MRASSSIRPDQLDLLGLWRSLPAALREQRGVRRRRGRRVVLVAHAGGHDAPRARRAAAAAGAAVHAAATRARRELDQRHAVRGRRRTRPEHRPARHRGHAGANGSTTSASPTPTFVENVAAAVGHTTVDADERIVVLADQDQTVPLPDGTSLQRARRGAPDRRHETPHDRLPAAGHDALPGVLRPAAAHRTRRLLGGRTGPHHERAQLRAPGQAGGARPDPVAALAPGDRAEDQPFALQPHPPRRRAHLPGAALVHHRQRRTARRRARPRPHAPPAPKSASGAPTRRSSRTARTSAATCRSSTCSTRAVSTTARRPPGRSGCEAVDTLVDVPGRAERHRARLPAGVLRPSAGCGSSTSRSTRARRSGRSSGSRSRGTSRTRSTD